MRKLLSAGLLLAVLPVSNACANETATPRSTVSRGDTLPELLATVDDERITRAELEAQVGDQLEALDVRYQRTRFTLVETALREILRQKVLEKEARRQGKTVEELLAAEIDSDATPTDAEVSAWYHANQGRLGRRSLEESRAQISNHLRQERVRLAAERLELRLHRELGVQVYLKPYAFEFDNSGAAARGPETARVTIVEFSDFQCGFCRQFVGTAKRIVEDFPQDVRFVYRHFPLSNHSHAFKASEAAFCAHEQGKFWSMHDLMFEETNRLRVTDLKEKAIRVGLEPQRFDTCLDSNRYAERVAADIREGNVAGVSGTPAVFVNGQLLEGGAVSYNVLKLAVERELARTTPR